MVNKDGEQPPQKENGISSYIWAFLRLILNNEFYKLSFADMELYYILAVRFDNTNNRINLLMDTFVEARQTELDEGEIQDQDLVEKTQIQLKLLRQDLGSGHSAARTLSARYPENKITNKLLAEYQKKLLNLIKLIDILPSLPPSPEINEGLHKINTRMDILLLVEKTMSFYDDVDDLMLEYETTQHSDSLAEKKRALLEQIEHSMQELETLEQVLAIQLSDSDPDLQFVRSRLKLLKEYKSDLDKLK